MGGPGKTESQQSQLASTEANTAQTYAGLAQQSLGTMNQLTAPAISYNQGLVNAANSGNYSQLISAAGPAVGANSQAGQQAAQNIRNTVPAGAGQQAALAALPYQVGNANAAALNQSYTGALNNLTQIGAAYGGVGLQEGSLNTSNNTAAASTLGQVGQEQSASKASTMGLLGSLAGLGGNLATGGAFSGLGGTSSSSSVGNGYSSPSGSYLPVPTLSPIQLPNLQP